MHLHLTGSGTRDASVYSNARVYSLISANISGMRTRPRSIVESGKQRCTISCDDSSDNDSDSNDDDNNNDNTTAANLHNRRPHTLTQQRAPLLLAWKRV
jgi:hypothetical protein